MQAPLPTRSTDATRLDNPTAGGSFFPVPAVTAPALDTRTLSRPRSRRFDTTGPDFIAKDPTFRGTPGGTAEARRLWGQGEDYDDYVFSWLYARHC